MRRRIVAGALTVALLGLALAFPILRNLLFRAEHVPSGELFASHGIFYQPQNADASLSSTQWDELWQHTRDVGFDRVFVQWTRHGNSDFGGGNGWLAQALTSAEEHGLKLVVGLSQDPHYYSVLPDNAGFASYWQQQMLETARQQRIVQDEWPLNPVGWYLSLELDDWLFRDPDVRNELNRQLADTARTLDGQLHLSMFTGGFLPPRRYAEWANTLTGNGWQVWWQDGHGTHSLDPALRATYEQDLACNIGIVREAFNTLSAPHETFRAEPAQPHTDPNSCHPQVVFSLRYMSWAGALRDESADDS
ncbi:DUF4434 domain-containing protein [Halomonas huangheensis]|uniref:DUF4434 domain-containing protein n=1 Tax=Halomonas huangheensis TaxID=1178482 RepID=W1N7S3_9GAMM|nr:DUF4434 domain-containing protein [Halomonas huangheensis]ALM53297.1 hypothetical protein AR456_14170 [Halomonas huangheensis]ERL51559.1 hypothetical protein BJB45_12955 [Halomonas huangheensis]